jgi:hypothetical protein
VVRPIAPAANPIQRRKNPGKASSPAIKTTAAVHHMYINDWTSIKVSEKRIRKN